MQFVLSHPWTSVAFSPAKFWSTLNKYSSSSKLILNSDQEPANNLQQKGGDCHCHFWSLDLHRKSFRQRTAQALDIVWKTKTKGTHPGRQTFSHHQSRSWMLPWTPREQLDSWKLRSDLFTYMYYGSQSKALGSRTRCQRLGNDKPYDFVRSDSHFTRQCKIMKGPQNMFLFQQKPSRSFLVLSFSYLCCISILFPARFCQNIPRREQTKFYDIPSENACHTPKILRVRDGIASASNAAAYFWQRI